MSRIHRSGAPLQQPLFTAGRGLAALLLALAFALPPWLWSAAASPAQAAQAGGVRWGYHVNFASDQSLASLRTQIGRLTHLSPRWYTLDAAGVLAVAPDPNRAALISLARANGVKLLPYVRNTAKWNDFTPFLTSAAARRAAVLNIAAAVTSENFDGIHLDFEEVNPADSSRLTAFVGELATALHARGKLITQAMGPKTDDARTGWGASWDYAGLGKVNDLVVIMAYSGSAAIVKPIAGFDWVAANAAYAVSKIPPEKVVLGIPWFGYDWNLTKGGPGAPLTGPQAQALAHTHDVAPQWSEKEQEHTFTYQSGEDQHRVWFSDQRSQDARLGLADKHNLAGAAFWRIGQEEPKVWQSLGSGFADQAPAAPQLEAPTMTPAPATATATRMAAPSPTMTAAPPSPTATSVPPSPTVTAAPPSPTVTPAAAAPSPAATRTAMASPAPARTPSVMATATLTRTPIAPPSAMPATAAPSPAATTIGTATATPDGLAALVVALSTGPTPTAPSAPLEITLPASAILADPSPQAPQSATAAAPAESSGDGFAVAALAVGVVMSALWRWRRRAGRATAEGGGPGGGAGAGVTPP